MMENQIICGDSAIELKKFLNSSVDMILTSPPYQNIYDYDGHYIYNFNTIAKQLYRVLKPGCVMVWVIGSKTNNFDEDDEPFIQALKFRKIGFKRLDTMIFQKKGFSKPEPLIRKRYVQSFDYMFILTKGRINKWNPLIDKKNTCAGMKHRGRTIRQKDGTLKVNKVDVLYYNEFGLRPNIWTYQNSFGHGTRDKIAYIHPATFPEKLSEDHIKTWSDEGDLVLDPFAGSGTTLKMALKNNRKFIGIEKNEKYVEIIKKRLHQHFLSERTYT